MIFQGLFAVKLSVLPFIGAKIESFMCFFRETGLMLKSPQNFTWWNNMLLILLLNGEQLLVTMGNKLNRTYCSIKPNTKRLEYILKEHHRRGNPEAKAIQPKTKKRKTEL